MNTPFFRALAAAKLVCDSLAVRFLTRDPSFPVWNLGELLRLRFERGWARHANSENPYAYRMFGGKPVPWSAERTTSIRFETADAVAFLESAPAGSFNAFALSNVADGATVMFRERLLKACVTPPQTTRLPCCEAFANRKTRRPPNSPRRIEP